MIYFGFQNWNDEYNWWTPNMIPKTLTINEKKEPPYTHGELWFNSGLSGMNSKEPRKTDFLYDHRMVNYSYLPTLKNKKYLFPVMIRNPDFFLQMKDYGFSFVSDQVFNDVIENRAKIVFMQPFEGTSGINISGQQQAPNDFEILNQWCKEKNLNSSQVFYIHANKKGSALCQGLNFTYRYIEPFVCWLGPQYQIVDQNFEKLFLSYNRYPRPHRTLLVCELIKRNLMQQGIVSYYGGGVKDTSNKIKLYQRPDLMQAAIELDKMIPLEIDLNLQKHNPANNLVQSHYARTFLSLVTETQVDKNTIFFSEKTWKPISIGHPFMLLSSPGMLKELRSQGYYTFGAWWNEGYDVMKNVDDRIRCIVSELERLSNYSSEQLHNMRNSMKPVLEHNQRKFNSQWEHDCSNHYETVLYRVVNEIWNLF